MRLDSTIVIYRITRVDYEFMMIEREHFSSTLCFFFRSTTEQVRDERC